MIKVFRKIRKTLISESKTSKYFKYAIGEIILVMIGILLALQVNTWNNNRELKKEELKALKSLHQEFNENLIRFDEIYNIHLKRKKSIETIMSIEVKKLSLDSLKTLRLAVGNNFTFDPYQGIYNSIINSGKIELISNDTLKHRISRFQDLVVDYQEEEKGTLEFTNINLFPFSIKNYNKNFNIVYNLNEVTEEEKNIARNSIIKEITSDTFENILVGIYGFMQGIFIEGPILREEMVTIINLLEKEIEKYNS